eukprot:g43498.t1
MEVVIKTNGSTTDPFPVQTGVKQGCIFAPTMFLIYLIAMLHLTARRELTYTNSRKLFNIYPLQAKAKVPQPVSLSCIHKSLIIKVHGEALENVGLLQYLRSVLSTKVVIDEEIQHYLQCAGAAFSCLRDDIFLDGTGWEGGDEWIRAQFSLYIHSLLATTVQP